MIEDCYKISILPTAVNLQTADGSPVFSIGKATLHLWIVDFKFSHTFKICNRLLITDFLFSIDLQKWHSLSYCWDSDTHLFIQREGSFLAYKRNREDLCNTALVKSMLKMPPRHNRLVPIKIKGHNLEDQVAYFISNQHSNPQWHGIYNIKGKSMLYVMVANYTNKHITFNKGQCIGHMEPPIDRMSQTSVNSVTTQKCWMIRFNQTASHPLTSPLFKSDTISRWIIGLI